MAGQWSDTCRVKLQNTFLRGLYTCVFLILYIKTTPTSSVPESSPAGHTSCDNISYIPPITGSFPPLYVRCHIHEVQQYSIHLMPNFFHLNRTVRTLVTVAVIHPLQKITDFIRPSLSYKLYLSCTPVFWFVWSFCINLFKRWRYSTYVVVIHIKLLCLKEPRGPCWLYICKLIMCQLIT